MNNRIRNTRQLPSRSKTRTPEHVIELERVKNAIIEGNSVSGIGPYGNGEIQRK